MDSVPGRARAVDAPFFVAGAARDASACLLPDRTGDVVEPPALLKPRGLPPRQRVRKRRDFERAYEEGKKVVTPEFALFARPNGLPHSRLGITTTRQLGKAVTRNRARRLVREAYRTHRQEIPTGLDLVFVVRSPLLGHKPAELGPILVSAAQEASKESIEA